MPNNEAKKDLDWIKILNAMALCLCAICLSIMAISLQPLAKWANNQNQCVVEEIAKSQAPISWGVRKCNGRSKVYQVK